LEETILLHEKQIPEVRSKENVAPVKDANMLFVKKKSEQIRLRS
jgi:hypothetical protein